MPVERRTRDAARRAEVGDGDAVEAAGREQLGRGREDLVATAHGRKVMVVNSTRWV